MERYDSIIVGAGHNGLVCAGYLAKSGQRVLVLEASDTAGGMVAPREFHPGFHASLAHSISHFPEEIANDLKLSAHGLEMRSKPLPTVGLSATGDHVILRSDTLIGATANDVQALPGYRKSMQRFAEVLRPFWLKTMPGLGNNNLAELLTFAHVGFNIRRIGRKEMQEFLRIISLPVRDLMDENFESELLKATLSWDGMIGSKLAPRSPNGAILAMLYRMSGDTRGAHTIPVGGTPALVQALSKSAAASGAEIRLSAEVSRILIDGTAEGLIARGVTLVNGETIEADRVISAADPKRTFLNLVGVEYLDIGFTNRIRRLRCDGYVAKLHLALNGVPEFDGMDQPDGRMIMAPDMDAIEFAFDNAKYGEIPEHPVMEMIVPSLHEPALAPEGQHLLSAHVMFVPYSLKGGWTDAAREGMCERAIDSIARYAPRIREQIIYREFLTPADLERQFRVTGGHWHHTEFAMDQLLMMRPTYEAAQYSTPIPGLYLCGAGCHPGGDITGAAGHNAAREILR